jgi:hypothetical protein
LDQRGRHLDILNDFCREAVLQYGDDWRRIERCVNARVSRLPHREREALRHDVFMTLRFEPPQRRRS